MKTLLLVLTALFAACQTPAEKAAAEAQAEAEAATEKRMAWTGAAMRRAGFKEEKIKQTLTQGGTVVAWGTNGDGQSEVPMALSGVVAIAAGYEHTVALKLPPAAPAVRP